MNEALDKLGWKLPDGCYSPKKADCEFAEIKNLMFKESVGATYSEFMFSNLVRNGMVSKADAVERYEKEGGLSKLRYTNSCATLGISPSLFNIKIKA